ncbi:hypothetical protein B0J11DRAFT_558277 [Dendryphion nanum]|uniref:Mediator of RNA polymerase II transcription subunit 12 n=1 Tax=Dendryphion nanum TaxID=256645 RepID=A0A9P9DWV2_9PLEO|nr:hypothetical protein B0J11DRAFT_558277 [Dendryphion nanum]
MTSRPGPGIQESLQHRGSSGPPRPQVRRQPSRPVINPHHVPLQDTIDPTLDDHRRAIEDPLNKTRPMLGAVKGKPPPLEGIHTGAYDSIRPLPKGKPQLFFGTLGNTTFENALSSPHGQAAMVGGNLPVPPRPGSSLPGHHPQQRRIFPGGTGVKGEPSVKAPSSDAPPLALLFPGGKPADFSPWTGTGPDDSLNESLVKIGINNKTSFGNESNTARNSIWNPLKNNKSSLSTLSTLFVAVLEKRQSSGRMSAPNSFKPPPRLTLRDSTRETWLHDLANPTVNLRRLSRTIPHGITGKALLEQCLNKNIPLSRAVWLAKCVGINEMRSHKRKGQAGTITWVRGWTSSVEQFLDNTIAAVGQQDWKPRITYALHLATQLYKDRLLEEDHYIDWILKNLESSVPERLFVWLLVVTIYWPDLVASRRRGKRLAEMLLNHAEKFYQLEDEFQNSPVLEFLEKVITKLLATRPACLLLPRGWDRYGAVLHTLARRHPHPQISRIVDVLEYRNVRVLCSSQNTPASKQDSHRKVLGLLDTVNYTTGVRIEQLAFECMELISDARILISIALQWASSLYRDGMYRVYLVTRLVRKWSQLGADIDDNVLFYLQSMYTKPGHDSQNIFRIIAELVRSKTFSVGRYLQWLIATGSASHSRDLSLSSAWPLRLITEIPLTGLPEQVRNLRSTLLRGTSHSAEAEDQSMDAAENMVRRQLPNLFGQDTLGYSPLNVNLHCISSTVRLELAILLRQQVSTSVEFCHRIPTKDPSLEESGPVSAITLHEFHVVRALLEKFGDLAILADVVGMVATSLDETVLASAADTLHHNYKTFSAIGALEPLFGKIAMRYAAIRTNRFPERELLLSLNDLCRTARADGHLKQAIVYDLSRYEQKNSVAACSPVSDTMADVVSTSAMDSDEEIDRILSSGTSMDYQIMVRVFGKIVNNLEEQLNKGFFPSGNHAIWFHRLRSFDETAFDGILSEWLKSLFVKHSVQLSHAAVPSLVTSGCLTLTRLLEISRGYIGTHKNTNPDLALQMCGHVLDLLLPSEQLSIVCPLQEGYRYRLEQQKFAHNADGVILTLIRDTLESASSSISPGVQQKMSSILSNHRLLAIMRFYATSSVKLLSSALGIGEVVFSEQTCHQIKALLDRLLDPTDHLGLSHKAIDEQVSIVVNTADYMSLPFCQLEIRQMFSSNTSQSEISVDSMSAALLEAVKLAVEKDQSSWCDLVAGLEADLTSKIREYAERELLNASAHFNNTSVFDPQTLDEEPEPFIRKYLTVIDFTASEAVVDGQLPIIAGLIERFRGIAEALNKIVDDQRLDLETKSSTLSARPVCAWLNALLRLTVVHSSVPLSKAPNQHQVALLWSLRSLFIHPALAVYPSISELVFDVAALLSDSISDEVRNHLTRLDAIKATDNARCAFVFGTVPPSDGWFALSKPAPLTATQASSSPQLQPSQPAQVQQVQSQQQQTPSPASMQRSLSQQQQQQQMQAQAQRMYSQYPQNTPQTQQSKMLSQFQRMASGAQGNQQSQLQQMQQMQQMQSLAQQRNSQPSPVQRQSTGPLQPGTPLGKPVPAKQEKIEMRQLPFALKRWEILPESGGNAMGNETAISMTLFGARKV